MAFSPVFNVLMILCKVFLFSVLINRKFFIPFPVNENGSKNAFYEKNRVRGYG